MNYADIKRVDVANGPGVRVSLFVSGCPHRCRECFNPEAWDFAYGRPFGPAETEQLIGLLDRDYIKGLSLLGGEPFAPQNQQALLELVLQVRRRLPQKTIWAWSGYLFEELAAGQVGGHSRALLEQLDVLVDGPFEVEQKDLGLRFRGSANQRIVEVAPSLERGQACLWDG